MIMVCMSQLKPAVTPSILQPGDLSPCKSSGYAALSPYSPPITATTLQLVSAPPLIAASTLQSPLAPPPPTDR